MQCQVAVGGAVVVSAGRLKLKIEFEAQYTSRQGTADQSYHQASPHLSPPTPFQGGFFFVNILTRQRQVQRVQYNVVFTPEANTDAVMHEYCSSSA